MPGTFASDPTNTFIRAQLGLVRVLCDQAGWTGDDCRRALNLTEQQWRSWIQFLAGGPLPPVPALPEMLRQLGEIAFNLLLMAEEGATPSNPGQHSSNAQHRTCPACVWG